MTPLHGATPESEHLTRLHIGCGLTYLEGWINCDGGPSTRLFSLLPAPVRWLLRRSGRLGKGRLAFWRFLEEHPIMYLNARDHWPFESESIDIIYSSHLIDCFTKAEILHFFQQASRVLKPGGQIRLLGMSVSLAVQTYLQRGDATWLTSVVSFPHPGEGSLAARLKRAVWPPVLYRAQMDFRVYQTLLSSHGFEEIVDLAPGETTIAALDPVNLWQRHGESVIVEARKSAANVLSKP
ncbi:MAG: methyltransferase domain-containing protein [Cyanobacteriota bacterium]